MNKKQTRRYVLGAVLILVLFFVLWRINDAPKTLERGAVFITKPIIKGGYYVSRQFSALKIFFENKKKLQEENERLYNILGASRTQLLLYEEIKKENKELKALLGRKETVEGVLGTVLSSPNRSPYDTLFIDVGEKHGVSKEMLVVFENALLGVIDTAYFTASKVKLFSSPGTELTVLLGEKKIRAIAHGRGGGEFEVKLPSDLKVNEGDVIVYPALTNYLVGVVIYAEAKPSSAIQEIFFRAPINIFTTQRVIVIPAPFVPPSNN